MTNQGEIVYYDRALNNCLTRSGMHINHDLVKFYHMVSCLKKMIIKIKLAKTYQKEYGEYISSWKIQRIIQKYKLYPNPKKTAKITKKRLKAAKKKRITELKKKPKSGFLLCLDVIEIRAKGVIRYTFTAIDHYSKVAFARMCTRELTPTMPLIFLTDSFIC